MLFFTSFSPSTFLPRLVTLKHQTVLGPQGRGQLSRLYAVALIHSLLILLVVQSVRIVVLLLSRAVDRRFIRRRWFVCSAERINVYRWWMLWFFRTQSGPCRIGKARGCIISRCFRCDRRGDALHRGCLRRVVIRNGHRVDFRSILNPSLISSEKISVA